MKFYFLGGLLGVSMHSQRVLFFSMLWREKTKRHVASLPPLFSALVPHLTNLPVKPLSSLFLFLFFQCFYSTWLKEFISSLYGTFHFRGFWSRHFGCLYNHACMVCYVDQWCITHAFFKHSCVCMILLSNLEESNTWILILIKDIS